LQARKWTTNSADISVKVAKAINGNLIEIYSYSIIRSKFLAKYASTRDFQVRPGFPMVLVNWEGDKIFLKVTKIQTLCPGKSQ